MNWKQRLRIEFYELDDRLKKLTQFLEQDHPELEDRDLLLLRRQQDVMSELQNILFVRLKNINWGLSLRMAWMKGNHECDWTEDFEHENGNYYGKCITCGCDFIGHKRRMECRKCPQPHRRMYEH